ncbi:hypothetical protein [Bradyrhizobium sp. USDA 10063]
MPRINVSDWSPSPYDHQLRVVVGHKCEISRGSLALLAIRFRASGHVRVASYACADDLFSQSATQSVMHSELDKILSLSPFVRKAAALFASTPGLVLDLARGSGRHTFYLAKFNVLVDCLDIDLDPHFVMQKRLANPQLLSRVSSTRFDLSKDP